MSRPTTAPPAHSFVRQATTRLHRRIDQTSILAALTNPGLRLPVYSIAMLMLERAYRDVDDLLLQAENLCPAGVPAYVPRTPGINRDLQALRVDPLNPHQPSFLKTPESAAAYLGMRYVVEGAQLGSRVIYNHLLQSLGNRVPDFASFWIPNPALQTSWPAVLKALAQVESRASVAAAARAARLTFRHMELHLAPNGIAAS